MTHWPGSFPFFRTGTNAAPVIEKFIIIGGWGSLQVLESRCSPSRIAMMGPIRKPLASRPTTTSTFFTPSLVGEMVLDMIWWVRWVMSTSNAVGLRRTGNRSRNTMPFVVHRPNDDRNRGSPKMRYDVNQNVWSKDKCLQTHLLGEVCMGRQHPSY